MKRKKLTSIVLAIAIASTSLTSKLAFADTENTNKEEIIYINLNNDGSVEGTYAVNIFEDVNIIDYGEYTSIKNMNTTDELSYKDGEITATNSKEKLYYEGTLDNIEIPWNITIKYYLDGKEISSKDVAGKSGNLEIKLNIEKNEKSNLSFFENYALQTTLLLDGNKYSNIEADGATIANVGSDKQLSYIILPGKGADISIKSNVKDFEMDSIAINGIKLNLNVDVNNDELMEKITELQNAIAQINSGAGLLSDGTVTLNDGASKLNSGILTLDSGTNSLNNGITQVKNALEALNSNSSSLVSGSSEVSNALNKISSELNNVSLSSENISALVTASTEISKGIDTLVEGITGLQGNINYETYKNVISSNGGNIDSLKQGNSAAIQMLENQISTLTASKEQLLNSGVLESNEQLIQINNQIDSFTQLIVLLQGNNSLIAGTETYLNSASDGISNVLSGAITLQQKYIEFNNAISTLTNTLNELVYNISTLSSAINILNSEYAAIDNGINNYTNGVQALLNGYGEVVNGTVTLLNGTSELKSASENLVLGTNSLNEKSNELSSGTSELNNKTSNLNAEVTNEIDNMVDELSGNSNEVISFVSDKNTNIKSVQFVMKTPQIKIEEVSYEEEEEEKSTLWQRIINLFK